MAETFMTPSDTPSKSAASFSISSSVLYKQLAALSGVIVNNPVVPILENFLFEIAVGKLKVTASDLQTSIITELVIEAQEEVKIAIPARILLDTLRNLPDQPITFAIDEHAYGIEIHAANGQYSLAGENAADFPQVVTVAGRVTVSMPAQVLKKAIQQTIIATSHDELRPAMNGVYMSFSETSAAFVATDGHRLVRYTRTDISVAAQESFIIPRKTLMLLTGLLSSDQAAVSITFGESSVHFQLSGTSMVARLIDERYPDYENVIPHNNPNQLAVNRASLLSSLKRTAVYANRTTHQIRLALGENTLQLLAEDLDFSNKAHEKLACDYTGQGLTIGFNAKLLMELLNSLDTKEVIMQLSEPSRAALILPQEQAAQEDILLLIMPVLLTPGA
ncbi:MAG: DNA polymerase III subunit beta [Bacteroidota bacterium]